MKPRKQINKPLQRKKPYPKRTSGDVEGRASRGDRPGCSSEEAPAPVGPTEPPGKTGRGGNGANKADAAATGSVR